MHAKAIEREVITMDPNAALEALRLAVRSDEDSQAAFEALDEWLSKGGFLPAAWDTGERPAGTGQIAPASESRLNGATIYRYEQDVPAKTGTCKHCGEHITDDAQGHGGHSPCFKHDGTDMHLCMTDTGEDTYAELS